MKQFARIAAERKGEIENLELKQVVRVTLEDMKRILGVADVSKGLKGTIVRVL